MIRDDRKTTCTKREGAKSKTIVRQPITEVNDNEP